LSKLTKSGSTSGLASYRLVGPPDKPQGMLLSINYEAAPVPDYNYVADFVQVSALDVQAYIVMGKLEYPGAKRLRNKVEIYFPAHTFVAQLWNSSRQLHKALREFAERTQCFPNLPELETLQCDRVQTLHANNVVMVHMGAECMLDFFYLSPKEMWLKTSKKAAITEMEALVRVVCSPTLLLSFLDMCDPVQDKLMKQFGREFYDPELTAAKILESQ
jgi:hypothetical protein